MLSETLADSVRHLLILRQIHLLKLILRQMYLHFATHSTIQTHLLKSKHLMRLIVIRSMRHSMMLTLILKRLMKRILRQRLKQMCLRFCDSFNDTDSLVEIESTF